MSNQRPGKMHAASLDAGDKFSLGSIVRYIRDAQKACESVNDSDAALRFELMAEYLANDLKSGQGLKFASKHIGL